jgi:antitoxin component of RelBE/YafQ-DinJ toxin-antitoxin module
MKTVSYSLDDETAAGIKDIAKKSKMSSSDVVRSMYTRMHLENTLQDMQSQAASLLEKLGLNTEGDVANYAKSKT